MIWSCLKSCCAPLPQRYIVAIMVLTGLAIQYVNRLVINLAITLITYKIAVTDDGKTLTICPKPNATTTEQDLESMAEFEWSSADQANVLGSFYIGYIITHLPGGYLADKYGPKRVMGYGVLMGAACTILTPMTARIHINLLIGLRFFLGLIQGPVFPSLSVFVARFSLPSERNVINSIMAAGVLTGAMFSNAMTGFLLYNIRPWDYVFYIYGIATFCWYIPWYLLAHEGPSSHPFMTEKERDLLLNELNKEMSEAKKSKVPYYEIFTSVPVWAMIIGNVAHDWTFYIIVTLLPQYMSYVLHFNIKENGFINTLPYIAMFIFTMGSAKISEILLKRKYLTKTVQCKIYLIISNFVSCGLYIWATYAGCNKLVVIILFALAMGLLGMIYSSVRVSNVDMSPNFAGTLMSLMNGMGAICGYFVPVLFGFFTKDGHSIEAWRNAFFATTAFVFTLTIFHTIFGSSKLQPWNNLNDDQQANDNANEEENAQ